MADVHTLAQVMNWAQKCKKAVFSVLPWPLEVIEDGLLEWEQGNWSEAYVSWRPSTSSRLVLSPEASRRYSHALPGACGCRF